MSLGVPHPQWLGSAPFRNPGNIIINRHYYYFLTAGNNYLVISCGGHLLVCWWQVTTITICATIITNYTAAWPGKTNNWVNIIQWLPRYKVNHCAFLITIFIDFATLESRQKCTFATLNNFLNFWSSQILVPFYLHETER